MKALIQKYATPLVSGLFAVSLVSGVALFFHVGQSSFHEMHEWLSMVLIVPFALHLWRNWRSFANYFQRPPMGVALGLSLIGAVGFAVPAMLGGDRSGGPPQFALAQRMAHATPDQLAPVFGTTSDALVARLKDNGFTQVGGATALDEAAQKSGKSAAELMQVLASAQ